RDLAEDVEALAPEKTIRLYLEGHDEIAGWLTGPAGQALARESHLGARFRAGWNRDRDSALGANFARPVAGGAVLRRNLAPTPALRARPCHGEPALPERDGSPPLAFRTGREGC